MRHKDLPATKPHHRIRAELSARGLTMADLSRAAGVGYLTLTRTLSGLQGPSSNVRYRVALALGKPENVLWGDPHTETRRAILLEAGAPFPTPDPKRTAAQNLVREMARERRGQRAGDPK